MRSSLLLGWRKTRPLIPLPCCFSPSSNPHRTFASTGGLLASNLSTSSKSPRDAARHSSLAEAEELHHDEDVDERIDHELRDDSVLLRRDHGELPEVVLSAELSLPICTFFFFFVLSVLSPGRSCPPGSLAAVGDRVMMRRKAERYVSESMSSLSNAKVDSLLPPSSLLLLLAVVVVAVVLLPEDSWMLTASARRRPPLLQMEA